MKVTINNNEVELPEGCLTVADLVTSGLIPEKGTAVAVNGKLVTGASRTEARLNDGDVLTVISAAYGG